MTTFTIGRTITAIVSNPDYMATFIFVYVLSFVYNQVFRLKVLLPFLEIRHAASLIFRILGLKVLIHLLRASSASLPGFMLSPRSSA